MLSAWAESRGIRARPLQRRMYCASSNLWASWVIVGTHGRGTMVQRLMSSLRLSKWTVRD